MLTLSIRAVQAQQICRQTERLDELYLKHPGISLDELIPLQHWLALTTTEQSDLWWFLRAAEPKALADTLLIQGALFAARQAQGLVVPLHQNACQTAIALIEGWLSDPRPERAHCAAAADIHQIQRPPVDPVLCMIPTDLAVAAIAHAANAVGATLSSRAATSTMVSMATYASAKALALPVLRKAMQEEFTLQQAMARGEIGDRL